jgi:acyl carrier protein
LEVFLSTTFERLMEIIRAQHHLDTSAVTEQTALVDAGLDSLAVAELLFSIEEVFRVDLGDVPPESVPATVGEIVALIDSKLGRKIASP